MSSINVELADIEFLEAFPPEQRAAKIRRLANTALLENPFHEFVGEDQFRAAFVAEVMAMLAETPEQRAARKEKFEAESRTERMLRRLKVGTDFLDKSLPKGYFSHGQYNSWLLCGRAYEFKYVEGVKAPGYPSTSKGGAAHKGVEHLVRAKMAKEEIDVDEALEATRAEFVRRADEVEDWGEGDAAAVRGATQDDALAMVKVYARDGLPHAHPVAVEKGFARKIGDVAMVGWIDRVDEVPVVAVKGMDAATQALSPTKRVVIDLKTGTKTWAQDAVDRNPQLTAYSVVEGALDVSVEQLVSSVKGPKYARLDSVRGHQDAAVYVEHLNEVVEHIKKGVFPKAQIDTWACSKKHCSFWSRCRGKKR